MERIRKFAEENWCKDEKEQLTVEDPEFAVSNPWIDHTGRFPLSDEGAVKEWGLPLVLEFCVKALARINEEEVKTDIPKIEAILFRHGENDFEL